MHYTHQFDLACERAWKYSQEDGERGAGLHKRGFNLSDNAEFGSKLIIDPKLPLSPPSASHRTVVKTEGVLFEVPL